MRGGRWGEGGSVVILVPDKPGRGFHLDWIQGGDRADREHSAPAPT